MAINVFGTFSGGHPGDLVAHDLTLGSFGITPVKDDFLFACYVIAAGSSVARFPSIRDTDDTLWLTANAILTFNDTRTVSMLVAYKKMGNTPNTQVRFTEAVGGGTGAVTDAGAYALAAIRGLDPYNPFGTVVTAGASNSSTADPPNVTPQMLNQMYLFFGGCAAATGTAYTSGMTAIDADHGVDTNDANAAVAWQLFSGLSALNPAAFGNVPAGTTSNSWAGLALPLRPAVSPPPRPVRNQFRMQNRRRAA